MQVHLCGVYSGTSDDLSTRDRPIGPKVSLVRKFHCIPISCLFSQFRFILAYLLPVICFVWTLLLLLCAVKKVVHYSLEMEALGVERAEEKMAMCDQLADLCCFLRAFPAAVKFYQQQVGSWTMLHTVVALSVYCCCATSYCL